MANTTTNIMSIAPNQPAASTRTTSQSTQPKYKPATRVGRKNFSDTLDKVNAKLDELKNAIKNDLVTDKQAQGTSDTPQDAPQQDENILSADEETKELSADNPKDTKSLPDEEIETADIFLGKEQPADVTKIFVDDKIPVEEVAPQTTPIDQKLPDEIATDDKTDNQSPENFLASNNMAYLFGLNSETLLATKAVDTQSTAAVAKVEGVQEVAPEQNLMTLMPQTNDANAQSMLNMLGGRSWRQLDTQTQAQAQLTEVQPQVQPQAQLTEVQPQIQAQGQLTEVQPQVQAQGQLTEVQPQVQSQAQPTEVQPQVQAQAQLTEVQPQVQPQAQLTEVQPQVQPQAQLTEVQPQVQPQVQPMNVQPQVQPQVQPTEVQPQVQAQAQLTEVQPQVQAQVQLTEVQPQVQPQAQLTEVQSQVQAQVQLTEVQPQIQAQVQLTEVQPQIQAQGQLTEVQPQVQAQGQLTEVQPQIQAQGQLTEVQPQVQTQVQTIDVQPQVQPQAQTIDVQPQVQPQPQLTEVQPQVQPQSQPMNVQPQVQPQAQLTEVQPQVQAQAQLTEVQPQVQAQVQPVVVQPKGNEQPAQNLSELLGVNVQVDDAPTAAPVTPPQSTPQQFNQQTQQDAQNFQGQFSQVTANDELQPQQVSTGGEVFAVNPAATSETPQTQPTQPTQAPDAPPPAPDDFDVPAQIVRQARLIRTAENTQMVIKLNPEHLGELTLRISVSQNGAVNASFHSDNAQVRTIIENSLVQLRQELNNQGLKVENVQVYAGLSEDSLMNGQGGQAWQQNRQQRQGNRRINFDSIERDIDAVNTATPVNRSSATDGVDYSV